MKTVTKTIITTVLILLSLLQAPLIFYSWGFSSILLIVFYCLAGLLLTVYLLIKLIKYRKTTTLYHTVGIALASTIGLLTMHSNIIARLDWRLRLSERNRIVNEVKNRVLKPNDPKDKELCFLPDSGIFPISKGNEISITHGFDNTLNVEFFIHFGFFGRYSAFLYTSKPLGIDSINDGSTEKLDDNWYIVNY